jgi:hypothetical protein
MLCAGMTERALRAWCRALLLANCLTIAVTILATMVLPNGPAASLPEYQDSAPELSDWPSHHHDYENGPIA